MDLDHRLALVEKMLAGLLQRGQFEQALKNVVFFYDHVEAGAVTPRLLERVVVLVRTCVDGAGHSPATSALAIEFLARLGGQVSQLIQALAYDQVLLLAERAVSLGEDLLPPEHLTGHLMNLGVLYDSLERLGQAEETFRRGVAICEHSGAAMVGLGAWFHARLASTAIKALGVTRDPAALARAKQHLAIAERAFDSVPGQPMVAQGLGLVRQLRTTISAAEAQRADSTAREVRIVDLLDRGNACRRSGDLEAATALHEEAVALARAPEDRAISLGCLASTRSDAGRFAEAEAALREILELGLAPTHPAILTTLNNLGVLYQRQGLYTQAREVYFRALATARTMYTGAELAVHVGNAAIVEKLVGRLADSESLFREAVALLEPTSAAEPDDLRLAMTLDNFGTLYELMGDPERAIALYRRALGVFMNGQPFELVSAVRVDATRARDVAICITNLGNAYHHLGQLPVAILHYQHARAIVREHLGDRHPMYGNAVYNLGTLHAATGNYVLAWQLFEDAIAIARTAHGPRSVDTATRLLGLGRLLTEIGKFDEAGAALDEASSILHASLGEDHSLVGAVATALGCLAAARGRFAEGFDHLMVAQAIDDRMIGHVFSIGSEVQRQKYIASIQTNTFGVLGLVAQHLATSRGAIAAACDLALRRKAIGAEALAVQRDAVLGGRYPELRPRIEELAAVKARLAEAALNGTGASSNAASIEQRDAIERELARQIPELVTAGQRTSIDRRAIAEALPGGAALVEIHRIDLFDFRHGLARGMSGFVPFGLGGLGIALPDQPSAWTGAAYLAFVVHAGRPEEVELVNLGDAAVIDDLVARVRTHVPETRVRDVVAGGIADPDEPERGDDSLRARVFDPLLPALGGCTQIFIAPDGALSCLPWEILSTPDGGRVIDRHAISYLSAGRDLVRFRAPSQLRAGPAVVIADPDFDLARVRGSRELTTVRFDRLPGAREEGELIARLLGVSPRMDGAALEGHVRAQVSPRILHISTHGYFLPDRSAAGGIELGPEGDATLSPLGRGQSNPLLRSGLALAGANTTLRGGELPTDAGDGILNGEDVSGLDLLATELVVLSACETGVGHVQLGEGVFGLRRAFVLAGARGLVMSLWKVPDEQTKELMTELYRRLQAGEPRAEALRRAQRSLKARFPAPFYWGGFIYQGEPGPLRS